MKTYYIFHQLRPVPPDGLNGLEHVYLAVLDHLLDARVGRTVDPGAALAVPENVINCF